MSKTRSEIVNTKNKSFKNHVQQQVLLEIKGGQQNDESSMTSTLGYFQISNNNLQNENEFQELIMIPKNNMNWLSFKVVHADGSKGLDPPI